MTTFNNPHTNEGSTPVLMLIFNRPDKVATLMGALSVTKPSRLYIAADGPRASHASDTAKCAEARRIAKEVSWPCEVHTLFSDTNLGVDPAVEAGIRWLFEHETRGIILEDDCIPHPDFFQFASCMLERYDDSENIMMVSGNNFQDGVRRGDGSYYFSRYANTWGWATWKRAWDRYDTRLEKLPEFITGDSISRIHGHKDERVFWLRYFEKLRSGRHTPWDAKWVFALWAYDGLAVVPNVNLVSNIGFGRDATHTLEKSGLSLATDTLPPPYLAPSVLTADPIADRHLFEKVFRVTVWSKIRYIFITLYGKARTRT